MTIRLFFAAACVAVAAGCTTSSGLTYNNDVITLANGTQAHRVQCLGLAGSTESCMDQVKKICGDKQALRVSAVDRAVSGLKPENDPREITVTCATPVAQQPVPQAAPQPVPQPAPVVAHAPARKVTLQGDANFELNSASLTPAAKASLDEFIAANRGVDIQQLTIAGYTDSTGSTAERSAVRGTCACGSGVSRFAWPARDQRQRERLRQRVTGRPEFVGRGPGEEPARRDSGRRSVKAFSGFFSARKRGPSFPGLALRGGIGIQPMPFFRLYDPADRARLSTR
jgi:OmpA-OmpF porin, OOP family